MLPETLRPILDSDAVDERARDLAAANLNGLRLALVTLGPPAAPGTALLEVVFWNTLHVADLLAEIAATPALAGQRFRIRGGHRVPAGPGTGEVKCTAVAAGSPDGAGRLESLLLTIAPVGDYSTYTLELQDPLNRIDPFFDRLPFKFRPGCFTADCAPAWEPGRAQAPAPVIDYLAKDYDSFRHTLIAAMMERVPGWQVTSEADLDQVLIDLFAAAGDELSDYQDRVMAEAGLATARKRVSLARHARLMDYHVHQGQQSGTWLALEIDSTAPRFTLSGAQPGQPSLGAVELGEELVAWVGHPDAPADWIWFTTRESRVGGADRRVLEPLLNRFALHTWANATPALAAGATSADLVPTLPGAGEPEAIRVRDMVRQGLLRVLLLEEKLNPRTGRPPGRDPRKRQLLELVAGDEPQAGGRAAQAIHDPLTGTWAVRVHWRDEDALRAEYCFTTSCPDGRVPGVSEFHGNLLEVHEGLPVRCDFHEPGAVLPDDVEMVPGDPRRLPHLHRHFVRHSLYGDPPRVRCDLPQAPLAYRATPPGGEVEPRTTLNVTVVAGAVGDPWDEVASLVHSDDSAEQGDHFVVETDEHRRSWLRFGDGVNGRQLPAGAVVECAYQVGGGVRGNVGAGTISRFRPLLALPSAIVRVWNPFDVTNGLDPEPVETILRAVPEAYRTRQLRAVTLADYAQRAEEVSGVARAVARRAWTGSWRTVRVVVDPVGTTELRPELTRAVARHLEAVRLAGEDLEIRPPRYVPLEITVRVCLHADYWPEDVRAVLEQEFSDGWTPDGRRGFFHPDGWTFGQPLHRSQVAGRLHAVAGVEHVLAIAVRRFDAAGPGVADGDVVEAGFDEILLVRNDPDHRERGTIDFDLQGGRR